MTSEFVDSTGFVNEEYQNLKKKIDKSGLLSPNENLVTQNRGVCYWSNCIYHSEIEDNFKKHLHDYHHLSATTLAQVELSFEKVLQLSKLLIQEQNLLYNMVRHLDDVVCTQMCHRLPQSQYQQQQQQQQSFGEIQTTLASANHQHPQSETSLSTLNLNNINNSNGSNAQPSNIINSLLSQFRHVSHQHIFDLLASTVVANTNTNSNSSTSSNINNSNSNNNNNVNTSNTSSTSEMSLNCTQTDQHHHQQQQQQQQQQQILGTLASIIRSQNANVTLPPCTVTVNNNNNSDTAAACASITFSGAGSDLHNSNSNNINHNNNNNSSNSSVSSHLGTQSSTTNHFLNYNISNGGSSNNNNNSSNNNNILVNNSISSSPNHLLTTVQMPIMNNSFQCNSNSSLSTPEADNNSNYILKQETATSLQPLKTKSLKRNSSSNPNSIYPNGLIDREYYRSHKVRPSASYVNLIKTAILESPRRELSLNEIYVWMQTEFAYFRDKEQKWKNAIRHNLSLHKCFQRKYGKLWIFNENEYNVKKSRNRFQYNIPLSSSEMENNENTADFDEGDDQHEINGSDEYSIKKESGLQDYSPSTGTESQLLSIKASNYMVDSSQIQDQHQSNLMQLCSGDDNNIIVSNNNDNTNSNNNVTSNNINNSYNHSADSGGGSNNNNMNYENVPTTMTGCPQSTATSSDWSSYMQNTPLLSTPLENTHDLDEWSSYLHKTAAAAAAALPASFVPAPVPSSSVNIIALPSSQTEESTTSSTTAATVK